MALAIGCSDRLSTDDVAAIPLLQRMLEAGDSSIVLQDAEGEYRFNADFVNVDGVLGALYESLPKLICGKVSSIISAASTALREVR